MEKIEEITSDEPFLLVSTIRSCSPFPLQIVSLKYKQVTVQPLCRCAVHGKLIENEQMCIVVTLSEVCMWQDCYDYSSVKYLHLIVPLCPLQPDDVEDVGGIPSVLSGRKFTH